MDDTLYHYCSVSTFASIINKNSIWLSSLSLSNDYMEGKLAKETIDRLLQNSNMTDNDTFRRIISATERMFDGLGFCLSQHADLLSQWRGYADDGQGFSIGFSKPYLKKLSTEKSEGNVYFDLCKAIYKPEKQEAVLWKVFEKIKNNIDSGILKEPNLFEQNDKKERTKTFLLHNWKFFVAIAFEILPKLYTLKTIAFEEESEWRLVLILVRDFESFRENLQWIDVNYRVARNRLIPYREIYLEDLNEMKRINEVCIGPKNITPEEEVKKFLYLHGYEGVKVYRSSATYR